MKKLLIVAALTLASLFGGISAANAGVTVCADVNLNGTNYGPGCNSVEVPPAPALP